jgi:hypothetical protein
MQTIRLAGNGLLVLAQAAEDRLMPKFMRALLALALPMSISGSLHPANRRQ